MHRLRLRRDTGSSRNYLLLMAGYLLVVGILQFVFLRGNIIGPDRILLFLLLGAIILGQARTFLRDWIPFVLLFFAWQLLRGYADQAASGAGIPVHGKDLVEAERWLFRGHIPTVVLQRALYDPKNLHWYDIAATAMWAFHFVLPIFFAYLLWIRNRGLYWRFVSALLTVSFAGFLTYILFPAMPPWMAAGKRMIIENGHVVRIPLIRIRVLRQLGGGDMSSWILEKGNPDQIAAMPSLHAAWPTLVFLFCLFYWRPLAPFALLYCFGLWFSVVYIGDHYVLDVLVGILYSVLAFFAVRAVAAWRARRAAARPPAAETVVASPTTPAPLS